MRRLLERLAGSSLRRTVAGRLFLLSGVVLSALFVVQRLTVLPTPIEILREVSAVAFLGALAWLAVVGIIQNWRGFLWRVRRKLILSYVFLGFVPLVLVLLFVLAGGALLYMTVATYMFYDGYQSSVDDVRQIAETSAIEIGRDPRVAQAALDRKYANLASTYPALSLAVVPVLAPSAAADAAPLPASTAAGGAWRHARPPSVAPRWLAAKPDGFAGTIVDPDPSTPGEPRLVIRAAVPTADGTRMVVADLPIDDNMIRRLQDRTGTRPSDFSVSACGMTSVPRDRPSRGVTHLFSRAVAYLDCTNWADGTAGGVSIDLDAPVGILSSRLASVRSSPIAAAVGDSWWRVIVDLLVLLGVLFLIIQGSALVMGWVLARSITSAVHELFIGTERVRQGDFAHRISIESRDQLGDLAGSFNRMSASMEHLLHVQREKQRLDDELRIAREIQKSLLPVEPPKIPCLDIADLCEPAREVGGDYYDFFDVGPNQLGVLIADVSGKGTSAALYMAELKGLMLALSQTERSPRRLLIDVNRRLADQLDNRSFITMTYAVIDLERLTLTAARAGHTPLIVVSDGQSEVLIPDGMVLGLRLPGASHRFEELLEEHTRVLKPGDVVVLYTDGITEAMDSAGELFGDEALARVLATQHTQSAAGIRERVVREVRAFVGDAEPHDDMTMVVLKVRAGNE